MEASDIALGRDGSLYVAEADNHIVRQIGPDGIIRTIAGIPGVNNPNGLEGVAVATPLSFPRHVTVAPDGTLFVSTSSHVMRISTNGSMRREVGSEGATTTSGVFLPEDGALARDEAVLPGAVAVSPDGVLHAVLGACSTQVCVASAHIVKIVSGRIQHVAGAFNGCGNEVCAAPWRDGDLAKGAEIGAGSLTFDAEGGLYFSSVSPYFLSDLGFFATFYRVASITAAGHLETRVGADDPVLYLRQPHDGGPAIGVRAHPIKDVDFGPDGLYLSGGATQGGSGGTVFRVSPRLPYESGESFSIGARDADAL
jgi:hypothetical protein